LSQKAKPETKNKEFFRQQDVNGNRKEGQDGK
jgi:hypothetical protein